LLALFKHAKNFVNKDMSRPVFNCIYFDGKRAIVTNTHLAVVVNDLPFKKQLIHYKTGEAVDGTFPDIDKFIPTETATNIEIDDLKTWLDAVKAMRTIIGRRYDYDVVSLIGNELSVNSESIKLTAILPVVNIYKAHPKISFSAKYLHDILAFMIDAGVQHLTLGINEKDSPMKFTTDKNIIAILTPIRTS
jgi:DNA polymerase III sliding clamp (beta) subunit (PCNA family)